MLSAVAVVLLAPASSALAIPLTVGFTGGSGTSGNLTGISINQPGQPVVIDCDYDGSTISGDCEHDLGVGDANAVQLNATPGPGVAFGDWTRANTGGFPSGCETGTSANPCVIQQIFNPTSLSVTANLIQALEPPELAFPAPGVEPVQDVTPTEAGFHGQVDPRGSELTECRFEYVEQADPNGFSSGAVRSAPCVPDPAGIGDEEEFVDVEAAVDDLEPATGYRVRLLARKTGASPPTVTAEAPPFATDGLAPSVVTRPAGSISDVGATLVGSVNFHNSPPVECGFEWGSTPSYGEVAPCAFIIGGQLVSDLDDVPLGNAPVEAIAVLFGLQPGSEIHYRVVADNGVPVDPGCAVDCETRAVGADTSFATRSEVSFPRRGFELASKLDTNGNTAVAEYASSDGHHLAYTSLLPLPDSEAGGLDASQFRASRASDDGVWAHEFMRARSFEPGGRYLYSEDDLSSAVFRLEGRDVLKVAGRAEVTDLYPSLGPGEPMSGHISADGELIVTRQNVEAWEDGAMEPIDVRPGSAERFPTSVLGAGIRLDSARRLDTTATAVSTDGSRIAFTAENRLFVRLRTAGETIEVSDGPGAHFWGADSALETVIYARGGGLFAYRIGSGVRDAIAPVGSNVVQVLDVSEGGGRVYFVAGAALAPGAESGTCQVGSDPVGTESPNFQGVLLQGVCNVYRADLTAESVDVIHIATATLSLGAYPWQPFRNYSASPDGSVLAFRALEQLVPGRPTAGRGQVYVYEAERDELSCASCPPDARAPGVYAHLVPTLVGGDPPALEYMNPFTGGIRNVSTNGGVFFQTREALLPADVNGMIDVYEWRGGRLSLVSAGTGGGHSYIGDASRDGSTVFISSVDELVSGVSAGVRRIYAARIGGGFRPPESAAPCTGEDCKPVASAQPNYAAPTTSMLRGSGNVRPQSHDCKPTQVRRRGRCVSRRALARKRCAKSAGAAKRRCIKRRTRRLGSAKRTVDANKGGRR